MLSRGAAGVAEWRSESETACAWHAGPEDTEQVYCRSESREIIRHRTERCPFYVNEKNIAARFDADRQIGALCVRLCARHGIQ